MAVVIVSRISADATHFGNELRTLVCHFPHSPDGEEHNVPLVPLSFRSCVFTKAFRFERWSKATKLMCHVYPPTITPTSRVLCICTHNRRRLGLLTSAHVLGESYTRRLPATMAELVVSVLSRGVHDATEHVFNGYVFDLPVLCIITPGWVVLTCTFGRHLLLGAIHVASTTAWTNHSCCTRVHDPISTCMWHCTFACRKAIMPHGRPHTIVLGWVPDWWAYCCFTPGLTRATLYWSRRFEFSIDGLTSCPECMVAVSSPTRKPQETFLVVLRPVTHFPRGMIVRQRLEVDFSFHGVYQPLARFEFIWCSGTTGCRWVRSVCMSRGGGGGVYS
jgi:hypothetical protein